MATPADNNDLYKVVLNHEEQYSIWLLVQPNPQGWFDAGRVGSQEECLAYIETVWTDIRPASVRRQLAEARR